MEMSEIYNGSQWAHDIFLVNKAGATEYITGRSSTLVMIYALMVLIAYNKTLKPIKIENINKNFSTKHESFLSPALWEILDPPLF